VSNDDAERMAVSPTKVKGLPNLKECWSRVSTDDGENS
jgi:hypothetical protein